MMKEHECVLWQESNRRRGEQKKNEMPRARGKQESCLCSFALEICLSVKGAFIAAAPPPRRLQRWFGYHSLTTANQARLDLPSEISSTLKHMQQKLQGKATPFARVILNPQMNTSFSPLCKPIILAPATFQVLLRLDRIESW